MPPRYTVHTKDLKKGAKIEAKEHPWASLTRARRIAKDHLQEKGPSAYRAEPIADNIIRNMNKKMGAKPIKRKPRPRPYNPWTDGLPHSVR